METGQGYSNDYDYKTRTPAGWVDDMASKQLVGGVVLHLPVL
jgi:hypothetical protein